MPIYKDNFKDTSLGLGMILPILYFFIPVHVVSF